MASPPLPATPVVSSALPATSAVVTAATAVATPLCSLRCLFLWIGTLLSSYLVASAFANVILHASEPCGCRIALTIYAMLSLLRYHCLARRSHDAKWLLLFMVTACIAIGVICDYVFVNIDLLVCYFITTMWTILEVTLSLIEASRSDSVVTVYLRGGAYYQEEEQPQPPGDGDIERAVERLLTRADEEEANAGDCAVCLESTVSQLAGCGHYLCATCCKSYVSHAFKARALCARQRNWAIARNRFRYVTCPVCRHEYALETPPSPPPAQGQGQQEEGNNPN